jgi:hypothetical protein
MSKININRLLASAIPLTSVVTTDKPVDYLQNYKKYDFMPIDKYVKKHGYSTNYPKVNKILEFIGINSWLALDWYKGGWIESWQEHDSDTGTCSTHRALVRGDGKIFSPEKSLRGETTCHEYTKHGKVIDGYLYFDQNNKEFKF